MSILKTACIDEDLFTYTLIEDKEFFVNFEKAQELCEEIDGNLARISNKEEFGVVNDLRINSSITWIGVDARNSKTGGEGNPKNFFFTDGVEENLDFFQNERGSPPWGFFEPNSNNELGENCVVMRFNSGLWHDFNCVDRFSAFICRSVNSTNCKNETVNEEIENFDLNENLSEDMLAFIIGLCLCCPLILILLFFIVRCIQERSDFELHENPNGIRPCEISGRDPPQEFNIHQHPYLIPEKVSYTRQGELSENSSYATKSTIVSEAYSADTTGVNFRTSTRY